MTKTDWRESARLSCATQVEARACCDISLAADKARVTEIKSGSVKGETKELIVGSLDKVRMSHFDTGT